LLTAWLPVQSELLHLLYLLCSHTFFQVVSNEFRAPLTLSCRQTTLHVGEMP